METSISPPPPPRPPSRWRQAIPHLLTLSNLSCGALAIVLSLLPATSAVLWLPVALICLGAAFDVLDGLAARLLGVSGPMGRELDSLADLVTFGLAPPAILLHLLLAQAPGEPPWHLWIAIGAVGVLPAFSAWRLAAFNLRAPTPGPFFIGLPTPANALYLCCVPLAALESRAPWAAGLLTPLPIAAICAVQAYLLVSPIWMLSFKLKRKREGIAQLFVVVCGAGLFGVFGAASAPLTLALYIVVSQVERRRYRQAHA
jgi:CDP-diacylglycerol---serine O-phosphatidyltransferase